jgi:cyclic pyranopterin phosphate synthase
LTIYDMAKSLDRTMEIGPIFLAEKTGGSRGDFRKAN